MTSYQRIQAAIEAENQKRALDGHKSEIKARVTDCKDTIVKGLKSMAETFLQCEIELTTVNEFGHVQVRQLISPVGMSFENRERVKELVFVLLDSVIDEMKDTIEEFKKVSQN